MAIGTIFEIATLPGVRLYTDNRSTLRALAETSSLRLALLPTRVRASTRPVPDDFLLVGSVSEYPGVRVGVVTRSHGTGGWWNRGRQR